MLKNNISNLRQEEKTSSFEMPKLITRGRLGFGRRLNDLRKEVLACGPPCNGGCCCCCQDIVKPL